MEVSNLLEIKGILDIRGGACKNISSQENSVRVGDYSYRNTYCNIYQDIVL
jgi:hypothetical protein